MKKGRVFLFHLLAFVVGAVGIGGYFWYKIAALPTNAALAGVALLPVAFVYIAGWGLVCLVSLAVCLIVSRMRRR